MLRHRSPRIHAGVPAVALLIALTLLAIAGGSSTARAAGLDDTTRLLVKFKDGTTPGRSADALAAVGAKQVGEVLDLGVKEISVPTVAADAVLRHLRGDDGVSYAEPDAVLAPQDNLPNDPSFPQQSAINGGAWGWTMTHTTQAWDVTKGDPSVVVAILDTGIKTSGLADFDGQIASTYNAMTKTSDVTTNAGNHGTYVAGVAGLALGNGTGGAGFCPSCKLMIVQVGTDSGASLSDIANGLIWAADHGARVANMSWAGTTDSATLASATTYAHNHGVVMTAAAGNSNCNCVTYPSADPYVVSVAGLDNTGGKAGDSNYGSWVKLAAPEANMTAWPSLNGSPGYAPVGGTSSAAPVVAGIAGLLFSANPSLTSGQVEQALESTAAPVGFSVQYGRVDALAALAALGFADPQASSAPVNASAPQLLVETNGDNNYVPLTTAPQVGQVLLRGQGGWTGSAPLSIASVQWQRCSATGACTTIATGAKYTVQSADTGYSLRFVVTVKNGLGSAALASPVSAPVGGSAPVPAPSSTSPPTISGPVQAGSTLTASTGAWSGSPTSYAYRWSRCDAAAANCAAVAGATASSYAVQTADVGATLVVAVTATNSGGTATATSAATAVVAAAPTPPASTSAPAISGLAQDGHTLTASTGTWSGSPTAYAYEWSRCDSSGANCAPITGASASTYAVQTGDVGGTLDVAVTATNAAGAGVATSAATAVVVSATPPPSPPGPTTKNVTFSGSLNGGNPSRTFSITVGAGLADAQLSFSKCSSLSLSLSNGASQTGPSVLVLDATLSAGTYTYTVSGGRCSFTLNLTAPSP